jgi:replicative DNA helicase
MWDAMERIEARHRGDETMKGVPSGFKDLEKMTNGFQASDLIIVAARPSMGKTSFCLDIAANAAIDGQVPVVLFSLEMSREQLVERLLASESFVDLQRLRTGGLRDDDFPRLSGAAGRLGGAKIWIDDSPALSLLELRSKARRLKAEHGTGLIIVDYLQLLRGPADAESRQAEISFISRSYAHLFEKDPDAQEGVAELILAKHRNGPTGTIKLTFNKHCTRFDSYTPQQPEEGDVF